MINGGKPAPVAVAKTHRLLRTMLNTAVEDELIAKNPCMIRGAGNEQSPQRPVATAEQVWKIADAIEPRYRALVLIGTYCTLRFGELFGLGRKHIDLGAHTVTVVEQVLHLASGELIVQPPKTAAGRRIVSIPASLVPEIQAHLDRYVADDPHAWVFRSQTGIVPRNRTGACSGAV